MISRHLNRRLTQPQRLQWVHLLLEAADEAGLQDDPEWGVPGGPYRGSAS